jgi:hypothetical protein
VLQLPQQQQRRAGWRLDQSAADRWQQPAAEATAEAEVVNVNEDRREYLRRYYQAHRETCDGANRRYQARIRAKVLDHYGRYCQCCGAEDDLTIDHVNGNGGQHRAEIGSTSSLSMYRWLIAHDYPVGFQTTVHAMQRIEA